MCTPLFKLKIIEIKKIPNDRLRNKLELQRKKNYQNVSLTLSLFNILNWASHICLFCLSLQFRSWFLYFLKGNPNFYSKLSQNDNILKPWLSSYGQLFSLFCDSPVPQYQTVCRGQLISYSICKRSYQLNLPSRADLYLHLW